MPEGPANLNRGGDRAIATAIALILFTIYSLGACRTIYVGDSGELVTAVYVLGIPHPSGYPLYVLVGKLWTLLVPIGSIAFRMSLFSAAAAAAACATLFVVARESGVGRAASLLGAALLAFAPSYWLEANTQRVYALNALLLAIAMRFALRWQRDRREHDLVVAMLVCGLGAANHTFMALAGIAIAIFAPACDPSLFRRPRLVALCGGAFFAGLLVYAYLPLRSRMNPILDWGDPQTPKRFFDVVLRRGFWDRAWYRSPADIAAVAWDFVSSALHETAWIGLPLALLAIILLRREWRRTLLPLLIIVANVAALAAHGSYQDIFVWHRYYIPGYAMVALLAAIGLQRILDRAGRVALVVLAVPAAMLAIGFPQNDRSAYRVAEDYSTKLLSELPPGSRLFATDDNVLFVLLYEHYVAGLRPDVELILQGVDQPKADFAFNPDEEPVFFTHYPGWQVPGLQIVPMGLTFQAVREGKPWARPNAPAPIEGESDVRVPKDYLTEALLGQYHFMMAVTGELRDWSRARSELDLALRSAPTNDVVAFNVGLVWARNGFYGEAISAFEQCRRNNPRHVAVGMGVAPAGTAPVRTAREMIGILEAERERISAVEARIMSDPSFPRDAAGTPAYEEAMARRLAASGEPVASRRHFLSVR